KRRTIIRLKAEAVAFPGFRIKLLDTVFQPARHPDDWNRSVFQAVELIQTTRFIAGRHEEHIRARLDLVGQYLFKGNAHANLAGVAWGDGPKIVLILFFTASQKNELKISF